MRKGRIFVNKNMPLKRKRCKKKKKKNMKPTWSGSAKSTIRRRARTAWSTSRRRHRPTGSFFGFDFESIHNTIHFVVCWGSTHVLLQGDPLGWAFPCPCHRHGLHLIPFLVGGINVRFLGLVLNFSFFHSFIHSFFLLLCRINTQAGAYQQ